ncbi:MAG: FtsW/RodA/SpoVE family cell cycle protein [Bacteroidaceae bacterium]|nr:FtsW/RodA/SpoVE family cell cycle protein [Bacteroidaceae bacterium]
MFKTNRIFQGDRAIWAVFFFLCLISLIEVFSAASMLSYKAGSFWDPLIKQAIFLGIGTLVVIGIHNIPCRYFKLLPMILVPLSVVLLLLASLVGGDINGAGRWLKVFGVSIQPSEFAKGAMIITEAFILSFMQRKDGADPRAFKLILGFAIVLCGLIFADNISTALMLFTVVFIMMFIGRVPLMLIGKLLGVLALCAVAGFFVLKALPDDPKDPIYDKPLMGRMATAKARVEKFGEQTEITKPEDFDMDRDAQVGHAHIAIASSNGVGLMPGNSVERDYLSHADCDFIYAIVIEEMGLWGAFGVIFLYTVLLIRAGRIASRCERNFPAFLVMGLALLLVFQAILNMLVAVGIFPVTGQPLPLISRGGSSTLINCAYIGMILSVSRYARKNEQPISQPTESSEIAEEFYNDKNLQ